MHSRRRQCAILQHKNIHKKKKKKKIKAAKMTMVEMCVHMDCAGCEARVRKALRKLRGVDDFSIDMEAQKVTVTGWADQKKVLRAVRRTGRRAVLWPSCSYYSNGTTAEYGHHYEHAQHHPACGPAGAGSSYNYYKHGYYQWPSNGGGGGGGGAGEGPGYLFSDENPNACSVM